MKFAYPEISGVFEFNRPYVNTLIIENQTLFYKLIRDISISIGGGTSPAVLSKNNTPIDMSKYSEIISNFISFELNKKQLLTKIAAELEKNALSPENYSDTQKILHTIENAVSEWAFDYPCNIMISKLTVSSLLKSLGIMIADDYEGINSNVEKIIDYMELVREFECDKLFITLNMRAYFHDKIINNFMETVIAHQYKVFMIESKDYPLLKQEKRRTIDEDLCEF